MKNESMILLIRAKKPGNIIGLKEDIAMRLAGVMDIERIDVAEDAAAVVRCKDCKHYILCNKQRTGCCEIDEMEKSANHFCRWGERKEK